MNVHDLIGVIGKQQVICLLIGDGMFIFSFCTVGNSYLKAENDDAPIVWRDWKTAVTTLFGVSFLALGRLVHLDPQVRGVTNILGWLLVLLSFSLPMPSR